MLNENIRMLRKQKGLSQEELADRLNVVRQTVSKWEQGRSVPDCEMLVKRADSLDTSVTILLGETVSAAEERDSLAVIAGRLELLNEQFVKKNERQRKLWHGVFAAVLIAALIYSAVKIILWCRLQSLLPYGPDASVSTMGGVDGPTSVWVSPASVNVVPLLLGAAVLAAALIGFVRTRRK